MNIPDVSKYLSPEEQKELLLRDDIKGLLEVLHTWLWIGAAFSLVYLWPNAFTITISLFILGGKQIIFMLISQVKVRLSRKVLGIILKVFQHLTVFRFVPILPLFTTF